MDNQEKTRYRWLLGTSIITAILVIIYLITHLGIINFCNTNGHEINYLNINQVNIINSTINNQETTNDSIRKAAIIDFLKKEYELNDTSDIIVFIKNSDLKTIQSFLPHYPIKTKSFFWLDGNRILLEIVFWSLFGLISNLLFSALSAKVFDPKKIPEQIGKFIYTPFLAIIIYLSIDLLSSSNTPTYESFGKGVIVLAFILGFYTRRAIVLLGRVKDLILPAKEREKKDDEDAIPEESKKDDNKKEENPFKKLSHDEQKRVINEYIKSEANQLKNQFDEIQGFSARRKEINNLEQDYYCLHIDIEDKKFDIEEHKKIPGKISFLDSNNIKYTFQTDISGVGLNELSFAKKFIGENQFPKQLGLSCSRKDSKATGTIGLMVYKNNENTPYLLSCYHVLCSNEMKSGDAIYVKDKSKDATIISPSKTDSKNDQTYAIAEVSEGILNHQMDVALAKISEQNLLQNVFYNYNGRVNGITHISSGDIRKRKVYLFGRSSGKSSGVIKDNYQGLVYLKGYPEKALKGGELWNLIVTSKISEKGDSGAAVVDANNRVIGILVGGNSKSSYVIPISTIINKFNINENKLKR